MHLGGSELPLSLEFSKQQINDTIKQPVLQDIPESIALLAVKRLFLQAEKFYAGLITNQPLPSNPKLRMRLRLSLQFSFTLTQVCR